MIRERTTNTVRVSYHRRHLSLDNQHPYSAIEKQRLNRVIHISLGSLRNISSTNTNNKLHEQISTTIDNHQNHIEEAKLSSIKTPIENEKRCTHSCTVTTIHRCNRFLSQKSGNVIKKSSSQLNSSTKSQIDQDSNVPRSSKIKSHLLKSCKVTCLEDVISGHDETNKNKSSDRKGMTEDYHRKSKKRKTKKCTRPCIILSSVAILLVILIITVILLALLLKSKSKTTTTPTGTPVLRWNSTGITVAGVVGNPGSGNNQLNTPLDVILDYANNLYVADYLNHRVQKPIRVILDSNENLYVSDANNHRIQFWCNGAIFGTTVAGISNSPGNSSNQLNFPYGIALNPTSGTLYIADYYNHRVMSYASGSNSGILVFGGNGGGTSNIQLYYPIGLHFDSLSNSLVVANYGAHNIVRFVLGVSTWTVAAGNSSGFSGATSTDLNSPLEATFDPMGNMYVADRNNHRIQFFHDGQLNGTTIAGITNVSGNNATTLNWPRSVRLDSQLNLYVADSNNHRIQKFLRY
ncbi:unnamed protein product [Rotaria sordida]|uniref:NHL repeat-containing protein n=1 Tax=Rotaria sordida TaxID=392033 RepID=A0A814TMM6_9BILA|nr:unnamed protein product [Rotaria sordida]CAF1415737.1 unnamed protein product [Rotaria sordida]